MKYFTLFLALIFSLSAFAQDSQSPLVSFDDYENLMKTVKEHRKTRLVDLDQFNKMSAEDDVYILDTRSKEMYDRKHVKGAIHLNFSDFTQANLDALFPNRYATILIYCNNNFIDDLDILNVTQDLSFASKVSLPDYSVIPEFTVIQSIELDAVTSQTENIDDKRRVIIPESSITLALNIPTYINLYGYGYPNIYELSELISIHDSRIQFEGTDVIPVEN